jgi:cytochrome c oxidase subunit 4
MTTPASPAVHDSGAHASVRTYVKVAVVLTVITGMEFAAIYIRQLAPILVPLLLVLSAVKFGLVVLFFMHLRYDRRVLAVLFGGPLLIAITLVVALMLLSAAVFVTLR